MKGIHLYRLSLLVGLLLVILIFTQSLAAQSSSKNGSDEGIDIKFWVQVILGVIGIYLAVGAEKVPGEIFTRMCPTKRWSRTATTFR